MLADSLFEGIKHLRDTYQSGHLLIPPPGERAKEWPVIVKPVVDLWQLSQAAVVVTWFAGLPNAVVPLWHVAQPVVIPV